MVSPLCSVTKPAFISRTLVYLESSLYYFTNLYRDEVGSESAKTKTSVQLRPIPILYSIECVFTVQCSNVGERFTSQEIYL